MSDSIEQSIYNKSRKDKFVFVLTLPKAMNDIARRTTSSRDSDIVLPRTLQFSVYGVVVPSVSVDSGEIRYSGQAVKFSAHSRPAYPNVNVNFTIDNRFNNYWVIWKWLDIMNDDKDAIFYADKTMAPTDSMFEQYQGTATLYSMDEYNKKTVQFDYLGVLPVSLGQIDYNYRTTEEIETTFEFSFSKLTPKLL